MFGWVFGFVWCFSVGFFFGQQGRLSSTVVTLVSEGF